MGKRAFGAALPVIESNNKEELKNIRILVSKVSYDGRYIYTNFGGEVEDILKFREKIEKFKETNNAKDLF